MLKSKSTSGVVKKKTRFTSMLLVMILSFLILCLAGCGSKSAPHSQDGFNNIIENPAGQEWATKQNYDQIADTNNYGYTSAKAIASSIDRKIIQNADLNLQVKDVSVAVDKILELNEQNDGYTVNSHIYKNADRISANLAVKVPQQKLNSFLASVAEFGEVTNKTITAEDVTEEYYDAETRLKVLAAKEARLLDLMDKAGNISDIISVENELSQTRGEIEVLTGRLKYLSNATDYSLISINLEQAIPGVVKTPQGTLGKAVQGLIGSLNQLINVAGNLVVFLFVLLPWAIVLGALAFLIRYLYKKRKARINNK